MDTARRWSRTLALAVAMGAGCTSSPTPAPPPPPQGLVLEVLARTASGRIDGVAGIPVLRHDALTGALVDTKVTDAAGRADFGVVLRPVTLSVVRPPPAAVGTTRAYTLLGLPPGTARLRLDRLPDEPGVPLATVDVPVAPALLTTESASVALPSGWQGNADPLAVDIPGVVVIDQDLQDDGKVTLLTQVNDLEMNTTVGCRLVKDELITATTTAVSNGAVSTPVAMSASGPFDLDGFLVVRHGVAFSLPQTRTCAAAFTDATGFSAQGSRALNAGADVQVADYHMERRTSQRRAALWYPGPSFPAPGAVPFPAFDASIEALAYGAGVVHLTLKGTAVHALVGAHARFAWTPASGGPRIRHLYRGLAVTPTSCDGTSADPACTIDQKLPDLAAMGLPPDQSDGQAIEVEVVAPGGAATSDAFWAALALGGDLDAVLARGYSGAYRALVQWKLNYILDVAPYVRPGWLPLGKVVGSAGIDCSLASQGNCTKTLPGGTSITLTAIPNSGAELVGWVGAACSSAGATPSVSFVMDRDVNCTPQFRSVVGQPSSPLGVGVVSVGNGFITSEDGWISCGYDTFHVLHVDCTFNYSPGWMVLLSASPTDTLNAYDVAWSGDCAGTSGSTSVVMDGPKNCQVNFTPR